MQPLVDTAGAGLSYLDTVLHLRARDGVVGKTCSRLLYVAKLTRGANSTDVANIHATYFAEVEADASGLVVFQPASYWALIECSPEGAAGLMKRVWKELQRPGTSLLSARVIGMSEDAPSRLFDQLFYQSVSLAPEVVPDLEADSPLNVSAPVYKSIVAAGYAIRDAGAGAQGLVARLDSFPGLPSDERCQALATLSKVRAWHQHIALPFGASYCCSLTQGSPQ